MNNDIESIASVHLGKAGDGTVVKPYITPDVVDTSLLVGIPRVLNRTAYGIDESNLPFEGFDAWNCYEFSTLTNNGFPVTGLLKIVYNSDSPRIVESKSLKLYLNSFNMMHNGKTVIEVVKNIEEKIFEDLVPILGTTELQVKLIFANTAAVAPITGYFDTLENEMDPSTIVFDQYNESPDIFVLENFHSAIISERWHSSVLRSNCRVTNQPDWGDVFIAMKTGQTVTPESMLQYIVSMRKENHFHEEIAECIYKRLYDLLNPEELFVACLYSRRGGIDINPVRASSYEVYLRYASNLFNANTPTIKTLKQ